MPVINKLWMATDEAQRRFVTDQFSSPGTAIGPVCVSGQ